MQILHNSRFRLTACIGWCLCWPGIAILLLQPLPFRLIARSDLLGHFLLFGLMTLSIVAFARTRGQIVALSTLSIAYGIALEFGQAYVPNRTFDVADAMANAIGGVIGCLLALILLERWIHGNERRQRPDASASDPSGR